MENVFNVCRTEDDRLVFTVGSSGFSLSDEDAINLAIQLLKNLNLNNLPLAAGKKIQDEKTV